MKKYEAIFIINPSLSDKDADEVMSAVNDIVKKNGGNITNSEKMGKKKLAYKIKKNREGIYYKIEFEIKPTATLAIKKVLQINANIIRFIIVDRVELVAEKVVK